MYTILNLISVLATIILIEGLVYFALNSTVGRLNFVKKLAYKDIVFLLIGIVLIISFFKFHLPY